MKILVLSIVGFQVAINNGNNVCALIPIDLLVFQVSHVVLARGQPGSKLFDNFSAMFFHEYFAHFDGDFGVFDESGTYNFVPNKRPPFSPFFKRQGCLKGRIR